ncbi:MAG: monovalent cation:proton antiporter-2 (CPA2) family protein [Hyphomicrobiaceae bacterium]
MDRSHLLEAVVLLATAALAAPLARAMRIGSVMGYLVAGIIIGPYGTALFYDVESVLHVAELGIVFLLFLIGLELRPIRLWTMRRSIFGAGGAQVLISGLVLAGVASLFVKNFAVATLVGMALAISSTAFVLQALDERRELNQRHGRLAFSILLFQDLAAIPLIAVVPMVANSGQSDPWQSFSAVVQALAMIVAIIICGHFLLNHVFRAVAASRVQEAMTATALLVVIGVSYLMQLAGLSAALGAFLAGALLADSEYRHQIEADIQPFEGLLLGLFFTAIGMSLNISLLWNQLALVLTLVVGLIVIKALILYAIGRWQGLMPAQSKRLAIALAQGGEFAFVILGLVTGARLLSEETTALLIVVVTLSMVVTPILLLLDSYFLPIKPNRLPAFEEPPEEEGHVVIAGLGRFGQIVARILRARGIPFTALDVSPEQIRLIRRFGSEGYFGDASRLDILKAAKIDKARAFVLAIDDVQSSLKTAEIVRRHFPEVPIYARARDRLHVHKLMDLGVVEMRRETFLAAVELTKDLLEGLNVRDSEIKRITEAFAALDRKRLYDDYEIATNAEKLTVNAKQFADELEELFREDETESDKLAPEGTSQTAAEEQNKSKSGSMSSTA